MKAYIQDDVIIRVEEIEIYTEEQLKNMYMVCVDIDEYVEPYKYKYIDGKLIYNENYRAIKKRMFVTDDNFQELWNKVSILINSAASNELIDNTTILEHSDDFLFWNKDLTCKRGTIVNEDGVLYRSLHDIIEPSQNLRPSAGPTMWKRIGNADDEIHEWSQPYGTLDAYQKGDMAKNKGKVWKSSIDNNVWEPGVIGTEALWEEVIV